MRKFIFGLYEPNMFKDKFDYVTSPDILLKGKMLFDPNGLFSEVIWPYSDNARYVKLAGIDLSNSGVFIHPKMYETIKLRQKILYEAINGTQIVFDEEEKRFKKKENRNEEGMSGLHALNVIIHNLDKYEEGLNPLLYRLFKKYQDRVFIQSIFVLPPALRDVQIIKDNVQSTSELNPLYQKVMRYANTTRIPKNKILNQELSFTDLQKILRIQNTINSIYDEYKKTLGKKEGFIRQNVLAKRIDFSARAVIGVDPTLPINKVKIPYKIIMKLAEPFIAYHIFTNEKLLDAFRKAAGELVTENTFSKYMTRLKNGQGSQEAYNIIKKVIDEFIVGKYPVILKRDPSLHMLSWQGFEFECVDADTIFISPLIVSGFNADFDGDQMAVYFPLTIEAQREVREKMENRTVNPGNGSTETTPSQDAILGPYLMTKDKDGPNMTYLKYGDVSLKDLQINTQIPFNAIITYTGSLGKTQMTYGQYIYNMIFLRVFKEPYLGKVDKKVIKKHVDMARKKLNEKEFILLTKKIIEISGQVVNIMPITIHPEELNVPEDIKKLKEKILKEEDFITAQKRIQTEVMPKLKKWLKSKHSGLYYMIDSGARGSWSDVEQLLVAKGYIADGTGRISKDPIISSLVEGLEPQEVMKMGPATVKGTQDRSLGTQETGRLERELVFTAQDVVISKTKDCKTKNYVKLKVSDENFAKSLRYRYCQEIGLITDDNYEKIIGKEINLRSPLTCTAKDGVCPICYGTLYKVLKTENVGLVAGQSVGERGTQLIMKTFHTGGKAETDVDKIPYLSDFTEGIDEYIKQVKSEFFAEKDIKLIINMKHIDVNYSDTGILFIKNGFFTVVDADDEEKYVVVDLLKSPIDFGIDIIDNNNITVVDNEYVVELKKGQKIGDLVFTQKDMSTNVKYISNLFHAQLYNDNYVKLFTTLTSMYATMGVLSVHIEVIVSQMMRVKGKLEYKWRHYQDKEYEIISTRNVIYYESPDLAVGFQNISKALDIALTIDPPKERKPGPLEQFAFDELETSSKITDYLK